MTGQGGGGIIKPGDTLLFDVELLGFHEKAKARWEMSATEIMAEAVRIKVPVYLEVCHVVTAEFLLNGRNTPHFEWSSMVVLLLSENAPRLDRSPVPCTCSC